MLKQLLAGMLPAAFSFVSALEAQTPPPAPTFEVASIKPAPPIDRAKIMAGKLHLGMTVDAARVDIGNLSLADLIRTAYRVKAFQVSGPDWMATQRFDILAKMPEGATKEQVPDMLQALLAERFKLAIHRETRSMPVYALVAGRNGPRLQPADGAEEPRTKPVACKSPSTGWSMQDLADCLDLYLYPTLVVDRTGLRGLYKITLDFSPPNGRGGLLGDGPDAFSAVESQLGLKLEDRKEPVEVIVIDRLEPPEAN